MSLGAAFKHSQDTQTSSTTLALGFVCFCSRPSADKSAHYTPLFTPACLGILLALRSSSNFRNFETGHNSGRTLKNRCILTHAGSPALHFPFSEAGAVVPLPCEHHQSSLRSQTASNELTEIVAGRLDRCILSKVHEERSLGYRRGAAKEKSCDEGLSRGPGDVVPPWSFFAQTPFWISTLLNS